MSNPVLIIGGGLAGLSCALRLHENNIPFQLFEATDRWGGRVGSEHVGGRILDRGFQVYLDAYPFAARRLDLSALDLRPYHSGALIPHRGKLRPLADPFRHPSRLPATLCGPLPPADLLRLARLNLACRRLTPEAALNTPDISTRAFLQSQGFSEAALTRFWTPFLGGIFLEDALETSAPMFHFVFSLFCRGRATRPRDGMQAIPDQLAGKLPPESLHLQTPVAEIHPDHIQLKGGEMLQARAVVDARDPWSAEPGMPACGTRCYYFETPPTPWKDPWLVLRPGRGAVNTLTNLTLLEPAPPPDAPHLLSVSSLNLQAGEPEIRAELAEILGEGARDWPLLKTYTLPNALPAQNPGHLQPPARTPAFASGTVLRCGDFFETASIEGALRSGDRAAEALISNPNS